MTIHNASGKTWVLHLAGGFFPRNLAWSEPAVLCRFRRSTDEASALVRELQQDRGNLQRPSI
jgi:hypothetical protein